MVGLESVISEIQAAKDAGNPLLEGQLYTKAGKILLERNIYPEAAVFYQRAAGLFAEVNENNHQARALNHLGVCLVLENQPQNALIQLNKARELAESEDDTALKAAVDGNIGLAFIAFDDYTNAIKAHKSALEAAELLEDPHLQLNALINLADSNLQNKNIRSAHGFALVALDLAKSLESLPSLVLLYDLLGMINSKKGDLQSAVEFHQQAYQAAFSQGDLLHQGIALANQALAFEGLTKYEQAYQAIQNAHHIFRDLNADYQHKTQKDLERIQANLA